MRAEWANNFYRSYQWKKCRSAYISYKRGLCERCLARGMIVSGNQVHHKIHLTVDNINDPSITCNFDNLELLCENCHNEAHTYTVNKQRYSVSKDGTVKGRIREELR